MVIALEDVVFNMTELIIVVFAKHTSGLTRKVFILIIVRQSTGLQLKTVAPKMQTQTESSCSN